MDAVEPGVGDGSVVPVDSHGDILKALGPARGPCVKGTNETTAAMAAMRSSDGGALRVAGERVERRACRLGTGIIYRPNI